MADGSLKEKLLALYRGAADPASEEEARSKAIALVRLAQKNGLALFVADDSNASAALTHDEVQALIDHERHKGLQALAMLRQAHELEIARLKERPQKVVPIERLPKSIFSWREVELYLFSIKRGIIVIVPFGSLPHPLTAQAETDTGEVWVFPHRARMPGLQAVRGPDGWRVSLVKDRLQVSSF